MENLFEMICRCRSASAAEEERQIMGEILSCVSPKLKGYLSRACGHPQLAEDLLQDTLLKIYIKLRSFRGKSSGEAMSWCYSIARNTLKSHFRSNKMEEHLEPLDPEPLRKVIDVTAEAEPLAEAEWQDLDAALALLEKAKPPCRGYLWSHYIRGMDYKAIAKAYGLSYNAARMQVKRCLKLAVKLTKKSL
jgi:RNA polymerase sigma-70 factor (ECF subfamily)